MRGDLVFNPGPDFVGVNKGQGGFATQRPRAQQQPWLVAHGIARTLRIGMLAEVRPEIVLEDRLQSFSHILPSQRGIDSVDSRHPRANDSVRQTSASVLVLGPFV